MSLSHSNSLRALASEVSLEPSQPTPSSLRGFHSLRDRLRRSTDNLRAATPSADSMRSPTPAGDEQPRPTRPSMDSSSSLNMRTPSTPKEGTPNYASLRSILKDRNTPGTGRSVRFFSKDAYKVISPEASAAEESVCGALSRDVG